MGTTAAQVCNQAIALINAQTWVTGAPGSFTDGSPQNVVGAAANILYPIARDLLLREMNPEFARLQITAVAPAGLASPISPWLYEYAYPADCVRMRQVAPPGTGAGSLADPNDPLPIRAAVAFDQNVTSPGRVVLTNQQNALLVYTSNTPGEATWDAGFAEAVARRLGNPFAMALAGRPEFARELLGEAERYASIGIENAEL